jgi:hypothetical protein
MNRLRLLALTGVICLAFGAAKAQPAGNTATASPPRAGPGYTNGWSLMTPEERREYRTKIMSITNMYACRAFVEQHHRLMVERAKQMGAGIPPPARLDVCDGLQG